jgi:zinc and cadmium transporter
LARAFSAGTFLCIAGSDLLPELQFHRHDRFALSLMLALGVGVAWGVGRLESRTHGHDHAPTAAHDDHAGHDHTNTETHP